jgi:hypothetical protein
MREREWLACTEPEDLLRFLDGKLSDRQLTLLACACCKHVWDGFSEPRIRRAVVLAEEFVDEQATLAELTFARNEAVASELEASPKTPTFDEAFFQPAAEWGPSDYEIEIVVWLARAAVGTASLACPESTETVRSDEESLRAMWAAAQVAASKAQMGAAVTREMSRDPSSADAEDEWGEEAGAAERAWQCELVRHIAGDPFRQRPRLPHVPALIRELAAAVYAEDRLAVGPLHDALLEVGLERLAAHFRDRREWHPRGCWALDLLIRRT